MENESHVIIAETSKNVSPLLRTRSIATAATTLIMATICALTVPTIVRTATTTSTRRDVRANAFGGNLDTFVTKFDSGGQELWTRQAGPYLDDLGLSLTVNSSNEIFVAGLTRSEIAPG